MIQIPLLSLWALDDCYQQDTICKHFISCGIWEVYGLEIRENNLHVYTMMAVIPSRDDLKIGEKRLMTKEQILCMCHQVKIIHLPKIDA